MDKVQSKKLLECKRNILIFIRKLLLFVLYRVGFKDTTTIERLCSAFPELDMVDHTHRTKLVKDYF